MEKLLECVNCHNEMKVKLTTFYLEGQADIWWRTTKEVDQQPEFTWEKFIEKLRERFYPPAVQRKMENDFMFLRQGTKTVLEYAAKFLELSRFAPDFVSTDKLKMTRFFEGLNFKYQKRIGRYATFQELYDQALEQERIDQREEEVTKRKNGDKAKEGSNKRPRQEFQKSRATSSYATIPSPQERANWKCRKCGGNHFKKVAMDRTYVLGASKMDIGLKNVLKLEIWVIVKAKEESQETLAREKLRPRGPDLETQGVGTEGSSVRL